MICPVCGKNEVYKYGKSKTGEQRYLCHNKNCPKKTFRIQYRYEGSKAGIDEKIINMSVNGSGIRDTSRVLKVSADKVMSTLKKQKI